MHVLLLSVAIAITPPAPSTQAERLERYITTVYHGADSYALELARRIIYEADHHRIPVELLAAVCHNESWFQLTARGTSGERGLWQVYPDDDWRKMTRVDQRHWARDIVYSTYRAAAILAYHLHRCKAQTARCAARYNSGGPRVRPGYVAALRTRARAIRRVLNGR